MIVEFSDCIEPSGGCIVLFHWTKKASTRSLVFKCIGSIRDDLYSGVVRSIIRTAFWSDFNERENYPFDQM